MERKRYAREFELEAVRLVKERGVSVAQASRDLGVHANILREWVRAFAADPEQAFPGRGQMKSDQLEVYQPKLDLTGGVWLSGRVFVSDALRLRSSSPLPSASRQGISPSAFCQSTNVPDASAVHCTRGSTNPDRPAGPRLNGTPFCGMRRGRIRSARSCGSARRCHWSAGSWS